MTKKALNFSSDASNGNIVDRNENALLNMDEYTAFQEGIQFGDRVLAKWTNSGRFYQVEGRIVKINARSFRVELLRACEGYLEGCKLTIEKYPGRGWSKSNGVFPVLEESADQEVEKVDYPFSIEKVYHSKKSINIWVLRIRPEYRVTRESFLSLKQEVKALNGYYSRFAKGFVFEAEPIQEILEEFAKTIETFYEKEREKETPAINFQPLSGETIAQFNFFRMFPYNLNEQYEVTLKTVMANIKEVTGLDYGDYTPLIQEAFEKYQAALREYQQRKASANMQAPNPWMTGRSGYKNMQRKMETADRTREIGLEKLEKAERQLNAALHHHQKIQSPPSTPDIDFTRDDLNGKIAQLRSKYKGKIEAIRIAFRGAKGGKRYVDYEIYIKGNRFEIFLSERGTVRLSNAVWRCRTLEEMLERMDLILEKSISSST